MSLFYVLYLYPCKIAQQIYAWYIHVWINENHDDCWRTDDRQKRTIADRQSRKKTRKKAESPKILSLGVSHPCLATVILLSTWWNRILRPEQAIQEISMWALHLRWILRAQGSIFQGNMLHRQKLSQLLELSYNLAGEAGFLIGSAWLSSVGPNLQLSSAQKKNQASSGSSTPSWLQLLELPQYYHSPLYTKLPYSIYIAS